MSELEPITRREQYLAAIAGEGETVPDKPLTREEAYLQAILDNGGGGGGGGTKNYNQLTNRPKANGKTIEGEMTTEDFVQIGEGLQFNEDGELEAVGGGGSAELTSDLTASVAVGGVKVGDEFEEGTSLETVVRNILSPTLYPTLTNPSASMTATGAKIIEKGGSLAVVFTLTLNRGSINPAYGTSGYRSGAATGYTLDGETKETNTFEKTITEAKTSYTGSISYAQGEQPKDSNGGNYDSPLPAGSVNTSAITYEFVNAIWANTSNISTVAKLSLVSKSTKQRDMTFPAQTVANPEIFDIPASWTVTAVQVKNDLSGAWEDASSQFTVTDTTHDDAGGVSTAYKRYTFNMGVGTGSRQIRVKWS